MIIHILLVFDQSPSVAGFSDRTVAYLFVLRVPVLFRASLLNLKHVHNRHQLTRQSFVFYELHCLHADGRIKNFVVKLLAWG